MENEINGEILEQICAVLDAATNPDNDLLSKIFSQFEELHSQLPTFCFYLLHIISEDKNPIQRRLIAIIVLKNNFRLLENSLTESFLSIAKPLLEEIIKQPYSPFTVVSATMLCSMIKMYGIEKFPDFYDQLSDLFTNSNTVQVGLECFKELIGSKQDIPEPLLQLLSQIINSPYCKTALDVSYLLCDKDDSFVLETILPSIFECSSSFDEDSLSVAASISSFLYLHYPIEDIADFLIACMNSNSVEINESILLELNNDKSFEIYPPLIERLLLLMELPDDDVTVFGPCSMAQQILQVASDVHGNEFNLIVNGFIDEHFPFIMDIYKSVKDGGTINEEQNVGFFLRCIYTILSNLRDGIDEENIQEIENKFEVYHTIIMGCFDSVFKGDAALCLMSFCFSNEQNINEALDHILPLLIDDDEGVRFQSLVALDSLVEFDNFTSNIEHFAFLIELAKSSNDVSIARLANRYAQHFPVLNDSNEFINDLYHELINFFITATIRINEEGQTEEQEKSSENENENGQIALFDENKFKSDELKKISFVSVTSPIFQSLVDMLSLFITVVVEPFENLDKRVFISILFSITNDNFEVSMFSSYFELILSLFKIYMNDIVSVISNGQNSEIDFFNIIQCILQKVMEILMFQNDASLLLIKDGYSIISQILTNVKSLQAQLVEDQTPDVQQFIEKFMEFSLEHFSLQNRNLTDFETDEDIKEASELNSVICSLISQIFNILIPKMNPEIAKNFLTKCYIILTQFYGDKKPDEIANEDSNEIIDSFTKDIKVFGLDLLLLFAENKIQVDEIIYNFFIALIPANSEDKDKDE